jgi:hypothetical protein
MALVWRVLAWSERSRWTAAAFFFSVSAIVLVAISVLAFGFGGLPSIGLLEGVLILVAGLAFLATVWTLVALGNLALERLGLIPPREVMVESARKVAGGRTNAMIAGLTAGALILSGVLMNDLDVDVAWIWTAHVAVAVVWLGYRMVERRRGRPVGAWAPAITAGAGWGAAAAAGIFFARGSIWLVGLWGIAGGVSIAGVVLWWWRLSSTWHRPATAQVEEHEAS